MSVLQFKEVQPLVRDIISMHSFFNETEEGSDDGILVIENRGKPQHEIEDALKEDGFCVVVFPLQASSEVRSGQGAASARMSIDVLFLFNPTKIEPFADDVSPDPALYPFDIYEMVENGIEAILNYQNNYQAHDRFFLVGIEIYDYDEGTWGYMVTFSKAVEFRRTA